MAPTPAGLDLARVIPTLIGSILSTLGAGFILACYALLPPQRHFRHALIINLALSDFLLALNNSVSGTYILFRGHDLTHGPGCVANGFFAQLMVQGTDCSILMIAIVTSLVIRRTYIIPDASTRAKCVVCILTWILPIVTSFVALGLDLYRPVNGNWCWIKAKPPHMRYVLTHLWRFLVIILSTAIYADLYFHLRGRYRNIRFLGSGNRQVHEQPPDDGPTQGPMEISTFSGTAKSAASVECHERPESPAPPKGSVMVARSFACQESYLHISGEQAPSAKPATQTKPAVTETQINKALLLNAYPIMYIILWLPGIANRIVEATGHSSRLVTVLLASTQYVGLANAITYGMNERVLNQLRERFSGSRTKAW